MLKKLIMVLLTIVCIFMMFNCGDQIDDEYGPDDETIKLEPGKDVISKYAMGNDDFLQEELKDTKFVRLHYHRNDDTDNNRSVYEPWNIWAWDIENGGAGEAYDFTHHDNYGVYVDLDLDVISSGKSTSSIGFIVRTDNWSKDPDGDRTIEIDSKSPGGVQDVYVKSNDATIFTSASNAMKSTISSAILRTMNTVDVYFKPQKNTFKAYVKRFSVTINGNDVTNFTMSEYNEKGKSVTLTFDEDLDVSDVITINYKFDSEWINKVPLMVTTFFDTDEFNEKYNYDGSDLGVTFDNEAAPTKTTFKVWAPTSKSVLLNLYHTSDYEKETSPYQTVDMMLGDKGVFSVTLNENLDGTYYTYTVTNSKGTNEVVDPYAKSAGVNGRRGMVVNFSKLNSELLGWSSDARVNFGDSNVDAIIYEMHVRDMTINPNSGVSKENRGKFLGLTEANTTYTEGEVTVTTGLDHLKELGITHVQVQPVYDFSSVDEKLSNNDMSDTNYNWGYDPQNYNVIEGSYSSNPYDGYARIKEYKQMIMALHKAGINLNMDVVYNHTSSTEASNFNLLVPYYYYRTFSSGKFYNGSGCGNEVASERYMVNKFIRESCLFYVNEYHVSGFRFDLMGLLDNRTMIDVYNDVTKVDKNIMVYGEPWTGGTTKLSDSLSSDKLNSQKTVQVSLAEDYFSGNNVLVGAFNDGIRNAIKGDNGPGRGYVQGLIANQVNISNMVKGIFAATNEKTKNINPNQVINYVSCHDNYTLNDQLVQTMKTEDINDMYMQADAISLLACGMPFIQEGEEFRRTKIVCTLGPAVDNEEVLEKVIKGGLNAARFNFSHGTHEEALERLTRFKKVCQKLGKHLPMILDTKGPEIRLGKMKAKTNLKTGQEFTFTVNDVIGDEKIVSVSHKNFPKDLKVGNKVLVDDGLVACEVIKITETDVITKVLNGGDINSNKKCKNISIDEQSTKCSNDTYLKKYILKIY